MSRLRERTSAMNSHLSGTMFVAYSAFNVPMLHVVSSSILRRFIFAIPLAATWIAEIPFSGARPAWDVLPLIVAMILICPGPHVITLPTSPLESRTIASLPLIMDQSMFLIPFIPPSSPMEKRISVFLHGMLFSLITLIASIIDATPHLSSPARIVEPSV